MTSYSKVVVSALLVMLVACAGGGPRQGSQSPAESAPADQFNGGLAFGSCLRQWQPQPVWQSVLASGASGFIFMGDNVYSDVGPYRQVPPPTNIAAAYQDLSLAPQFAAFRKQADQRGLSLMATWDDHDYGENDGGKDYPYQRQSREEFADFFNLNLLELGDGLGRGVYHSRFLSVAGLRVQVILLDTRSFRSPLKYAETKQACAPTGLIPETDPGASILGDDQWLWLGTQLGKPADLRLLVSSIQVLPDEHCFEKWANFPAERQRLFALIDQHQAAGVVILSGDRHLGEISKLDSSVVGYPLYEVTSSGLNSAMAAASPAAKESNALRVAGANLLADNFGYIAVRGQSPDAEIALQLRDASGVVRREVRVPLASLK